MILSVHWECPRSPLTASLKLCVDRISAMYALPMKMGVNLDGRPGDSICGTEMIISSGIRRCLESLQYMESGDAVLAPQSALLAWCATSWESRCPLSHV
ncbi:hypothetical protein M404DRAFT_1007180 [Pisolithus tinctorius Marx 270]|uniref:Uncharacterized protein n=1 Tax=Pisolithus tinctorius Marx 270 TaxID=870435 RepID=A0A0C3N416_PISTI|nr:hypothetical protein M404DRAFT_1007180 [Pisolithus tinctorius Marx 270]